MVGVITMKYKKLSTRIADKVKEQVDKSSHKELIYLLVYCGMVLLFSYTIVYQFSDGTPMTRTKIVGITIFPIIVAVGLLGVFAYIKRGNRLSFLFPTYHYWV